MNRRTIGFNPRLSSPGRSRLNTDDWYNKLYQSSVEQYQQQINNSQAERKADYTGLNFSNFMDYANADSEEFADKFMSVKQPESVDEIGDVVITPKSVEDTIKQLGDERKALKGKKWLSGLTGNKLSNKEERDLLELDSWHKLIYSDGYKIASIPTGVNRQLSAQELALELARKRLSDLGGAPEGYWERSAKHLFVDLALAGGGAAIGATLGSAVPVVGTTIGAVIGAASSLLFTPNFADKGSKDLSNIIDDITTSFQRKANEVQVGTSKGKILRSQELILLAQTGLKEYEDLIKMHDDLTREFNVLLQKRLRDGLTQDEVNRYNYIENKLKYQSLKEAAALNKLDKLGSYDPYEGMNLGPVDVAWQKLNRALDIDYAPESLDFLNRVDFSYDLGIRDDLSGLKNQLRKLRWARLLGDRIGFLEAIDQVRGTLNAFVNNTQKRFPGWTLDIEHDLEDIKRLDNRYKVTEYYEILDLLAQDLGLFSPKKILFSSAGLLGSSMSSTPKSLLRIGSWFLGMGATSAPRILGAVGLNVISGGAQATDENNAEVGDTFQISDFINILSQHKMIGEVLADGRKQLDDKNASIEDVLTAFTEGRIMFSDTAVRNEMLNIIAGANQLWAYDMNATAPGVWTEAATLLIPDSWYIAAMKYGSRYISKPIRNLYKDFKLLNSAEARALSQGIPEEELLRIEQQAAKNHWYDPVIIPARNLSSKISNKFLESAAAKVIDQMQDKFSVVAEFGKKIPTNWIKSPVKRAAAAWNSPTSAAYKRAAKSMTLRSMWGMSSEFWEEDVLSIRQHLRAKGELGSEFMSGTYNPSLILDNVLDGIKSSWDFIWKDPALATQEEKEIWREAKLGALGFLLLGGAPVFIRSSRGAWKQASMTNVIYSQILADKAENDAAIKKGQLFASRAKTFDDYIMAMRAFDDIERYNQRKNKAAQQSNSEEDAAFADESMAENRRLYQAIFNLVNDRAVNEVLNKAGLEVGTDDYNTAISIFARHGELANRARENEDRSNEDIENFAAVLKNEASFLQYLEKNGIQFTAPETKPQQIPIPKGRLGGQKKQELEKKLQVANEEALKKDKDRRVTWLYNQRLQYEEFIDGLMYLASVGAIIDLINVYSALEGISGKLSDYLKHLKKTLADINKERTDEGYVPFETIDDVLSLVKDNSIYEAFKDMYRKKYGYEQDSYMYDSILDELTRSRKIQKGTETEDSWLIKKMVDLYKSNQKSDLALLQAIEDDFFKILRHLETVSEFVKNRHINSNNDVYRGYDGLLYVVIPKKNNNGETVYLKYKYDPDTRREEGAPMFFDEEEYYYSNMADEYEFLRELDGNVSDEERVKLGRRRIAREKIQADRREQERSDWHQQLVENNQWFYSEGEESQPSDPQQTSKEFVLRQDAERARREQELEEHHLRLAEENNWNYSEGEEYVEDENWQRPAEQEELPAEPEHPLSDRVRKLLDDGYTPIERKTPRGKIIRYMKKGRSKVTISEEEYNQWVKYHIALTRQQNLRSRSFYEYDPALSVTQHGVFSKDSGYAYVEALILNAAYSGNEDLFNNLLESFKLTLTEELIEDFRLMWLMVNGYLAEEREAMNVSNDEREKYLRGVLLFEKITGAILAMLDSVSDSVFKLQHIIKQIDVEYTKSLVQQFAESEYPRNKGIMIKQLMDSSKGVSKAVIMYAILKAKWHVFENNKGVFVLSPSGSVLKITESLYKFYNFLKAQLQPKLLEFEFKEEPPTFDAIIEFIRQLGYAKQLENGLPVVIPGIGVDQRTMVNSILNIPGYYKNRGVGVFAPRVVYTASQDDATSRISRMAIDKNQNILHQYTNPLHYFIKEENGKIYAYDRVHAYNEYARNNNAYVTPREIDPEYSSYLAVYKSLINLKTKFDSNSISADEYNKQVFKVLQKAAIERNKSLADKFGITSTEYKNNAINISGYRLLDKIPLGIEEQLAAMLAFDPLWRVSSFDNAYSNSTPVAWYESGTIVDNIARALVRDRVVVNRPEYKMSDDVFERLKNSILHLIDIFERLGFKLISDEILVKGKIGNTRVAGVMDMVAISRTGDIYIVDFKSTSGLRLYPKDVDTISAVNYTALSPKEAKEYRRTNGQFEVDFDRKLLKDYRQLVGMYNELFVLTFGDISVKGLYIAPIYVQREYGEDSSGTVSKSILKSITAAEAFKPFLINPDFSLIEKGVDWTEVNNKIQQIDDAISKINQALANKNLPFTPGPLLGIHDIRKEVASIHSLVNELRYPDDALREKIDSVLEEIAKFNEKARKYFSEQQPPIIPTPPQGPQARRKRFNPNRRPDTGELYNYNNIDRRKYPSGWDLKKIDAWNRVTAAPDFIENSVWELNTSLYIQQMGTLRNSYKSTNAPGGILVNISYTEHNSDGTTTNWLFGGLMLQVATQINGTKMVDVRNQNPLLAKIDSILFDIVDDNTFRTKDGAANIRIVFKNKSRINGIERFTKDGSVKPITHVFKIQDDQIESLITQGGNEIGLVGVGARDSIGYIKPSGRNERTIAYPIPDGRGVRNGMLHMILKLLYNEDGGNKNHTPVIALTPAPLTDNDIDFFVDLLRHYGSYRNKSFKIKIGDAEYDSPLSVETIVYRMLLRFRGGRETDNKFVFDFLKTDKDKYDFNQIVATDWETGEMLQPFDLRTDDGVLRLKEYLQNGANVWYENEDLLLRGTTQKRDNSKNNPFLELESFFKQHPEITQIKYSDHLVFDRQDFDPNDDGSFSGINGFHWMVRHGWILSDFERMEDPLLSAEDVEEIKPEVLKQDSLPQVDDFPLISEASAAEGVPFDPIGDEFFNLNDVAEADMSDFEKIFGDNKTVEKRPLEKLLDREQAERRLKHILGKSFPVRFIPTIVEALSGGGISIGRLTRNGIILSDYAENGSEFHEAFHGVVEILMPEAMRKHLYAHFKKQYLNNRDVQRGVIAEGLADLYYDFKQNSPEIKITWNIFKTFKNISEYVRALSLLNDYKIAMLFAATDAGVFRLFNASPRKFIEYETRYKDGLNMTISLPSGSSKALVNFGNYRQIDDAVNVLVYKFVNAAGIDLLGSNLRKLDTRLGAIQTTLLADPKEKKILQDLYIQLHKLYGNAAWDKIEHSKAYRMLTLEGKSDEQLAKLIEANVLSPLTVRNAKMFREVFENWDYFRPIVENKIEALGVDKKQIREAAAVEDQDGGEGYNQEEFGHYEQPFYEHSIRDDVPSKIKFFLSTIPNHRYVDANDVAAGRVASIYRTVIDENGNPKKQRLFIDGSKNSLGYTTYMPYSRVYNTMLRLCHNARSILEFDDLLEQYGKNDYALYRIHRAYHRFRTLMYRRWTENDFENKQYAKVPKVMVRNSSRFKTVKLKNGLELLHPSEYTATEFPNVVRYAYDVKDNTGAVIHRQGDVIEDAVILTNPDYELLVTLLYQAVHAQRLNFQHTYTVGEYDDNGKFTGKYSYDVQSTDQSYSTQIYPRLWFNSLRTSFGGIFSVDENGSIVIEKYNGNPSLVFGNAAKALREMQSAISTDPEVSFGKVNVHRVPVRGLYKDLYDDDEFSEIQIEFVRRLNEVGISIDVSTLNYMLLLKYPNLSAREGFRSMFTSTDIDSMFPLIEPGGILDTMQAALNGGNINMFFTDKEKHDAVNDADISTPALGFVLYSDNGFLKDLSKWVGLYKLASTEAMQIGPNNTKLYTYALHHSASEGVLELNHVFDEHGNLAQEGLIYDLQKSPYVVSEDGSEGSIIAKTVLDPKFNPNHDKIKLATSSGIRLNTSNTGGTKYSEITAREDWLTKAAILQAGNIIFPTLSDKSTWFYLLGFVLPGINYKNLAKYSVQLPKFSNTLNSRIFFNADSFNSKSKQLYYTDKNDVIDQLIEYAYRELELVNQTMNALGILKENHTDHYLEPTERVENFHTGTINGARFAFLTGVYGRYTELEDDFEFDENVDEFYEFNVYDESNPEQSVIISRERAMRVFFDKRAGESDDLLRARQRSMIANIIQHRVKNQLDDLVEKGIIEKLPKSEYKVFKNSKGDTVYNEKISDFLQYKNIFLDANAINSLILVYRQMPIGKGTYESTFTDLQIESAAIVAYVYDITTKSIMSKEETQRIFTGFPHFFTWKFKDGHLVDIIGDESKRHGGEGSTGTSNISDLPNISKTYKCAEIEDYEIESPILSSLHISFRNGAYRDTLALALKEQFLDRFGSTSVRGENIYSGGSDFAKLLTNPKNKTPFEFRGRTYENAEHAYQTWKRGMFDEVVYKDFKKYPKGLGDADRSINFDLMVRILTEKLILNYYLVEGITQRGGRLYIANSKHIVPGKYDNYWHSTGKNRFLAALYLAYENALYDKNSLRRKNKFYILTISSKTEAFNVEISYGSKDFWNKINNGWLQNNANGIVAYRRNGNRPESFTPETVNRGWIGNPFSTQNRGEITVQQFYDFLITGINPDPQSYPYATEEFRLSVILKLLSTPEESPVLYYTELNRPSHATVIAYLINNKHLLQNADNNENIYTELELDALIPYTEEIADHVVAGFGNISLLEEKYLADARNAEIDKIYDRVYKMHIQDVENELSKIENGLYKQVADNKVTALVNSFRRSRKEKLDGINTTDGTAYITDKMAENLLRMRGAWNSDIEYAFNLLRGNETKSHYLSNINAYLKIVNALIGAQKYSAFGYRMQYGLPVHFYNKYALFPIFKEISYGFTAELYKKMNDPENGVDMVMFKSSVKVGQQGGLRFNPDMTEEDLRNFSFKDHTYELHYRFIRRQLNTDPHERENMMVGTQAAKVALQTLNDSQTYRLRNGEMVRGREIKNRIMNAIIALSKIGEDKVVDAFFKDVQRDDAGKIVSRTLDVKKFAQFIKNELQKRDADKNILDAVQDLEDTGNPVLNSVSNMKWIESILISYINKNIIDINLPGNAFYQRTAFGMEGILSDENYPLLANGIKLKMKNEEGSMDAVVSIDYYYDIIPAQFRYNFKKAKQWLIDNNIISGVRSFDGKWHNATANIMAYRIPTLAVSSIHALRIVDVLPVVRDTIVLPLEFTKITGSDFDIDKLYLSRIKYKVSKISYQNNIEGSNDIEDFDLYGGPVYNKPEIEYDASPYFSRETDPEAYYQNELLDLYLSLLKDENYSHILHRPVDNDTDLIKQVLGKIEVSRKQSPVESFVAGSLYTQSNLKSALAVGKFGIGPFALNNNNHILTKLYNVSFKSSANSIMTLLNADSLHEENDRDGNSIGAWISALINAHVDVAKDPYILRLNVNKFTYNLISLLIRTGFGKDALYFVAQPILKQLALEYLSLNGDVVSDPLQSPADRWKDAELEFIKNIDFGDDVVNKLASKVNQVGNAKFDNNDFIASSPIFLELFGIRDGKYNQKKPTLLERLLTDTSFLKDANGEFTLDNYRTDKFIQINGDKFSPKELLGYVYVAKKQFDIYAQALSDLVLTTKIDTKKHGISYSEQRMYKQRYEKLKDYTNSLFDSNLKSMLEDSFIDHKTNAAIDILPEILKPQMIHFTDRFTELEDSMTDLINNRSMDTRKALLEQLLAYSKLKAMNRVMELYDIDFNSLIRGNNSLSNRVEALKHKILSDTSGQYSLFASNGVITNSILANIHPVPYISDFGLSHYSLLSLDNSVDDDPDIENDYIDSWLQMWESSDEDIKTIARDLAIYAFMTSADTRGLSKFFKYVPYKLRKDIGYVEYVNQMYRNFATGVVQLASNGTDMNTISVNELFRNSWRNNKIIPIYKPNENKIVGHRMLYDDINKVNGETIKRNSWLIFYVTLNNSKKNDYGLYAPYVKMRRPHSSPKDPDPYLLYKLVNVGLYNGNEVPIYALTEAKGVSIRTGTDVYEIYEFDRNDQNGHITSGNRLDNINWEAYTGQLFGTVQRYMLANPKHTEASIMNYIIENKSDRPKSEQLASNVENGKLTLYELPAVGYSEILKSMYRAEARRIDINEGRYSDKFMKFCKSA